MDPNNELKMGEREVQLLNVKVCCWSYKHDANIHDSGSCASCLYGFSSLAFLLLNAYNANFFNPTERTIIPNTAFEGSLTELHRVGFRRIEDQIPMTIDAYRVYIPIICLYAHQEKFHRVLERLDIEGIQIVTLWYLTRLIPETFS